MKLQGVSEENLKYQSQSIWDKIYNKYLSPGDVVYDIGAYKGVTTAGFAKKGFVVHAFEGAPSNFTDLKYNTKDFDNVIIHEVGLHNRCYTTTTRFNDCNAPAGQHESFEVKYVTLDSLADDLPDPKYIKMDIEGMESVVLLEAKHLLKTVKPIWQLSLHPNQVSYGMDYPGWVSKEMGGFDFDVLFDDYDIYLEDETKISSWQGFNEYLLVPKK